MPTPLVVAGIDEAGYGPLLGPLAVGLAAFRAREGGDAAGVEDSLRRALGRGRDRIRVGDSKEIHRPAEGPRAIEEGVLAFLVARDGAAPADGESLLAALGALPPPADHPWYGGLPRMRVPLAADPALVARRGRSLRAALHRAGLEVVALEVRLLPEGRYNDAVAREGTKSAALFRETAALLGRALAAAAGGRAEVLCDRQGARASYGPLLQRDFPEHLVRVLAERPGASAYAVGEGRVRFEEKADGASLAVGLASMAAKYAREVHMAALNAWFAARAPGVRPTAGYWTDGLRFLRDTEEARRALGVDDGVLVRRR